MPIGAETQTFSSISALLSALTLVLLGAVLLSRSRRPAYRAFIVLCGNVLLWHLFNIFRGGDRSSYLALSAQIALPLTLVGFLRTWLSSGRDLGSEPRRSGRARVSLAHAAEEREQGVVPAQRGGRVGAALVAQQVLLHAAAEGRRIAGVLDTHQLERDHLRIHPAA